jgi:hypothetical protein
MPAAPTDTSAPYTPGATDTPATEDRGLGDYAAAVLGAVHVADDRGLCEGCFNLLARLVWFPCEQAKREQNSQDSPAGS